MHDLLEAIQIFAKYTDEKYPTWCEHDVFHVCVDPAKVSEEDIKRLNELGFFPEDDESFKSFRFGNC